LKLYSTGNAPTDLCISSITTFDVGAMGKGNLSKQLFRKYCDRLKLYANEYGYNWQSVSSNLDTFYSKARSGFQRTHVIRNVAAAYLFEDIFSTYLYSSTYPYKDINTINDDLAYIEPMLLPLLSTQKLRFLSAGAGLSRLEKTTLISDFKPAETLLDVCIARPGQRLSGKYINCSKCWKCSRAIVTLEILGKMANFSEVFDLELYSREKLQAIEVIKRSAARGKPADRDLLQFMKVKNFTY